MSLLRDAIRGVLRPTVKATAGVSIRYHSITSGIVYPVDGSTITATLDASAADAETADGIQFTEMVKDFKIDVCDLPVVPQDRDYVIVVSGLGIPDQWYQVLPTSGSRSAEPLGNFEDTWRLHTKNVPNPGMDTGVVYGNAAGTAYGNDDAEGVTYGSPSS